MKNILLFFIVLLFALPAFGQDTKLEEELSKPSLHLGAYGGLSTGLRRTVGERTLEGVGGFRQAWHPEGGFFALFKWNKRHAFRFSMGWNDAAGGDGFYEGVNKDTPNLFWGDNRFSSYTTFFNLNLAWQWRSKSNFFIEPGVSFISDRSGLLHLEDETHFKFIEYRPTSTSRTNPALSLQVGYTLPLTKRRTHELSFALFGQVGLQKIGEIHYWVRDDSGDYNLKQVTNGSNFGLRVLYNFQLLPRKNFKQLRQEKN
jgi:hypothetical protein